MKKITLASLVAVVGMASIGCTSTANTNATVKTTNLNANTAVVVNTSTVNTNGTGVSTTGNSSMSSSSRYNSNMSRADYDKSTDFDADRAASTIGQGADDKWIWFKTRAALLGTDDLRESTVNVDVSNGIITLKGSVATQAQKDKATSVASGIEGKKGVKNELMVKAGDSMTNQMTGGSTTDGDKKAVNANHK